MQTVLFHEVLAVVIENSEGHCDVNALRILLLKWLSNDEVNYLPYHRFPFGLA